MHSPPACAHGSGRNKPSKFEVPREEDEEALEGELAPLASEALR